MDSDVIFQPKDGKLLDRFRQILRELSPRSEVKILTFVCSIDIIQEMEDEIRQILRNNGRFKIIIGYSKNTRPDREVITKLKELIGPENIFVYYSENTFHPKFYLIKNGNRHSMIIVGSSNFTLSGFTTNFETNAMIKYQFPMDDLFFNKYESIFNQLEDPPSVRLDKILKMSNDYWPPSPQKPVVEQKPTDENVTDFEGALKRLATPPPHPIINIPKGNDPVIGPGPPPPPPVINIPKRKDPVIGPGPPHPPSDKKRLAGFRSALTKGFKINQEEYERLCRKMGIDPDVDRAIRRRNGEKSRHIKRS